MVPQSYSNYSNLRQYFRYVSIHNYAFTRDNVCQDNSIDEVPESPQGGFLTLKNMKKWMDLKMPNAKLNITEFGWNNDSIQSECNPIPVGEANQAIYNMRAWLLAARYGLNRAFNYATHNAGPIEGTYCTTGLVDDLDNNGVYEKKISS